MLFPPYSSQYWIFRISFGFELPLATERPLLMVRCQRSRTASETFGAVGEVHPLEAWTRHQRSSRSISEAAAATEEHRLEASAGRQRSRRGWFCLWWTILLYSPMRNIFSHRCLSTPISPCVLIIREDSSAMFWATLPRHDLMLKPERSQKSVRK